MNSTLPKQHHFINANLEPVEYDGSPITWRISAYALIIKDGKLLIGKSKFEKHYDVIGGGIELGETIEEALHREALEEGGVTIKIGKLLFAATDWFYHRKGNFHETLQLYYEAQIVRDIESPTDPDIEQARFIPLEEIGSVYPLSVSPQVDTLIKHYLRQKMVFHGIIIEESLIDNRMLNEFSIKKVRVTTEEDPTQRWHLYFVEGTNKQIEQLVNNLKPQKWYAHFWSGDRIIVVFPHKLFIFSHTSKETWKEAVEYGISIGIPQDQLTFEIEE
ncbi:hypothetical protein C5B42_02815 [Candidatus Cerribacteria bacterium 'Amazon FNV 2010 28 9']|uniref:Nudix hydrolase domain-containing protein n=1 Tax=Candidatus Cerribacteria bacterium 'Amazon FNV 2010 28 9' TaxID=2081795 RepID=A0A317JNU6_9BACT|nr:MAG: hypothetical protein C5B42_02815 [Candidatus Cerribacteria bacterium 'Amazon FNV 2010 28 9']